MKVTLSEKSLRRLIRQETTKLLKEQEENAFNTIDDMQSKFIEEFNKILKEKWARKIKMLKYVDNSFQFILIGDGDERVKLEWNPKWDVTIKGKIKVSPIKALRIGLEFSEKMYRVIVKIIENEKVIYPILEEISTMMKDGGMGKEEVKDTSEKKVDDSLTDESSTDESNNDSEKGEKDA